MNNALDFKSEWSGFDPRSGVLKQDTISLVNKLSMIIDIRHCAYPLPPLKYVGWISCTCRDALRAPVLGIINERVFSLKVIGFYHSMA